MTNAVAVDFSALLSRDDLNASDVIALRRIAFAGRESRVAFRDFVSALEAKGGDAGEKLVLGICYWAQGQYAKALDAVSGEKSGVVARYIEGRALLALGRLNEAADVLKALASKSGWSEARAALSEALRRMGDLQSARSTVKDVLKDGGACAELLAEAGVLADLAGESAVAEEYYMKALGRDAECAKALFRIAYLADLRGDNDVALEYYRRCVQVKPVHSRALINLGLLYEELGRDREAHTCYKLVHERFPADPRARLYVKDSAASQDMYFDEDQQKRRERRNKILETPITDFELSVRSRNCLEKMSVTTVGDLTRISEIELLAFKNFGETSLTEIKQMMTAKGLRLGQALEGEPSPVPVKARALKKKAVDETKIFSKSVDDIGFSVRSRHCMQMLGIQTVADLVARSERELMEARNFGATSLQEVKKRLAAYGLSLKQ